MFAVSDFNTVSSTSGLIFMDFESYHIRFYITSVYNNCSGFDMAGTITKNICHFTVGLHYLGNIKLIYSAF